MFEHVMTGVPIDLLKVIRANPFQKKSDVPRYTPTDGKLLELYLRESGYKDAQLIGSLSRGKFSNNDIDILLPGRVATPQLIEHLRFVLTAKGKVTPTDWDGLFFEDTLFGDVDIFFTTEYFDYY